MEQTTKYESYCSQAEANKAKTASQIKVGDFILTATGMGKDNDFTDLIDAIINWECAKQPRLCRVVDTVEIPEDFDFLSDWLALPAPPHRGGSQSDDVADDKPSHKWTNEDIATFFDLVTLFRKPSGKWLAVDCQGYDYWRYVHIPTNYAQIFGQEYAEAVATLERRNAEAEAAKCAKLAAHAQEYKKRVEEVKTRYPYLTQHPANSRQVGNNIRKWFKFRFPQLAVKVSATLNYWRTAYRVDIEAPKDTPQELRDQMAEACKEWRESYPLGEIDSSEYREFEAHGCPMGIFGNIEYGINVDYWL